MISPEARQSPRGEVRLLAAALVYAKRGLAVFPLKARDKAPVTKHGFKDATTDSQQIEAWWEGWPEQNIGVATGEVSGVWVLDVDGEEGEASLRRLVEKHGPLPQTVEGITGNGRHLYFRWVEGIGCTAKRLGPGLDTRGNDGYVVAPPSVHPSGRLYTWSVDSAGEFADAPEWLVELVRSKPRKTNGANGQDRASDRAAIIGRLPPHLLALIDTEVEKGKRSEHSFNVMCGMFKIGLTDLEVHLVADGAPFAAKYWDRGDLLEEIHRARDRWERDGNRASTDAWVDPDISLLDDRRGDLPSFPIEVLPLAWRHWLERAATGAGVLPDHVIVPLLAIASSLIGASRRVRASLSWYAPLSLWTAIVGYSGSGKTPGLEVSRRALARIERIRKESVTEQRIGHEEIAAIAKAALKNWNREVKEALEKGHAPPSRPSGVDDPGPFVAPRFLVSDVTTERLAVLIQARPRGMLVVVDELAGLFANMSRYNKGSDREFWLQAWNGGHYVVERLNRPPVVLDQLLVGLTGGFQPDKLDKAFAGADDGMYGRILFSWPVEPSYQPLTDDVAEIEPEFQEALMRLIDLKSEDGVPRDVPLSDAAREAFEEFRRLRNSRKGELDGRERELWAKSEAQVLRLAGTLTYMDWSMLSAPSLTPAPEDRFQEILKLAEEPTEIDVRFVRAAIRLWCDYFWPHGRAALRQVGRSERHRDARRALRWIKVGKRMVVSREDLRREALGQRLDAEQTQAVIEVLMKAGWFREQPSGRRGAGRPARRWETNPLLFSK